VFCGRDGTPLFIQSQEITQTNSNRKTFILVGVIGSVVVCLFALSVLAIAFSIDESKSNRAISNSDSSTSTNQSNINVPIKTSGAINSATAQIKTSPTPLAHTEREYAIYREVVSAPSSESENQSLIRIGKKYGISPKEAKAITQRVMKIVYSGDSSDKEQQIRAALSQLVKIKSITVSGDFVGVLYLEEKAAWDDAHVQKIVKEKMPQVLAAIFSVAGIEQTKIKVFYTTTDGTDMEIAGLSTYRSDFSLHKNVEAYSTFWQR
jgi:hypothetical protein